MAKDHIPRPWVPRNDQVRALWMLRGDDGRIARYLELLAQYLRYRKDYDILVASWAHKGAKLALGQQLRNIVAEMRTIDQKVMAVVGEAPDPDFDFDDVPF